MAETTDNLEVLANRIKTAIKNYDLKNLASWK